MSDLIEWKRGDSFIVDEPGTLVEDAAGTLSMTVNGVTVPASALNMTGWTVTSQIRRKDTGDLVSDTYFSWTNVVIGAYRLQVKDTTNWPLTTLAWDVQFCDPDGFTTSTDTIYLRCRKDQTRAA